MTINIITLGCSKNTVDSEVLASNYQKQGYSVLFEADADSDIVLINTCSFIQDAKEQSIEEIFTQIERKNRGEVKKVFVMGCLAQRYKDDLLKMIPEVDGIFSFSELPKMLHIDKFNLLEKADRLLSTPKHYAYLKVSEGCDRQCAFCAIPMIRGKQVSKPIEQLHDEAELLVSKGVKEIMLIAQDLSNYGTDIAKRQQLDKLLESLAQIKGLEWIRLHYLFPIHFPYEMLDVMNHYPQFCKYLDIPLQHISENVLRSMNRPGTPDQLYKFIDTIREKVPGIAFRTTMLSGFPTETKTNHKELVKFIEDIRFERLGVFSYSREDDTPAFPLGDPVKKSEKKKRFEELMSVQENISFENNRKKTGTVLKVMVDAEEDEYYLGRSEFDSPEVDNLVLIDKKSTLEIGDFYPVRIQDADAFDLFGTVLNAEIN
jgi:ribosomal protein S12 methylthiotransferase